MKPIGWIAIGLGLMTGAASVWVSDAMAEDGVPVDYRCHSLASAKDAADSAVSSWVAMTPEQWQFSRGIAMMTPGTPNTVPPGASGVLSIRPDGDGVMIFVDEDKACEMIGIYKALVDTIISVGKGELIHSDIGKPL
jgi:hypothetical protein